MKYCLEVCVDSLESAIAAEQGGATRLELCENLVIGGTTPSPAFFRQVRRAVSIPIHVLVRPRFGDFLYSAAEKEQMEQEIRDLVAVGADFFVIGALQPSGQLDGDTIKRLMAAAPKCGFGLHRAFDMTADLQESLREAIDLGISVILTSGGEPSAQIGAENIRQLAASAAGRIEIMAGAGINSSNLADLVPAVGGHAYHMSGKIMTESGMKYRNKRVFMGIPGMSEYEKYVTDAQEIRKAVRILESIDSGNQEAVGNE